MASGVNSVRVICLFLYKVFKTLLGAICSSQGDSLNSRKPFQSEAFITSLPKQTYILHILLITFKQQQRQFLVAPRNKNITTVYVVFVVIKTPNRDAGR